MFVYNSVSPKMGLFFFLFFFYLSFFSFFFFASLWNFSVNMSTYLFIILCQFCVLTQKSKQYKFLFLVIMN